MDSNRENKKHEQDFFRFSLRTTSTEVIIWKLKNWYRKCRTDGRFDSPTFNFHFADWCFRFYPKNCNEGCIDSIGLILARLSSPVHYHKLHVILKHGKCIEKSLVFVFDDEHKENEDMEFSSSLVEMCSLEEEIDSFALVCQISLCGSPSVDAFAQTEFLTQDMEALETLCQNFKNLLLNGQDHDVVFKVKDKDFRAHRNILRARSPVLESMLNHDMIEKNRGIIDIPDCDPSAFEQFLCYLYCAKVETLDTDNMLSLYYVADKYDLEHLKEECREFIKKSLSTSNITDVIEIALNHSDSDLLQCTTDYFVDHINVILPTVEWQSFIQRKGIQANELIMKAVNKMSGVKT